jgi:hypothetical protein
MDAAARLWEIEQIKQLKARYFRGVDTEDWELFGSVFTEDVRTKLPGTDWMEGRHVIVGRVVEHHSRADVVTVHHGHMPEIELIDGSRARGVWAMFDFVDRIWKLDGRRDAFQGYGHYLEEYRKDDGVWRIAQMELTRIRVDWLRPEHFHDFPRRGAPPVDAQQPS